MKVSSFIGVCLAAAAAGLIVLWILRADRISSSASGGAVTHPSGQSSERADLATGAMDESVDSDSDRLEPSPSEDASDSRLAERQQNMTAALYRASGGKLVQRLVDSGLSRSDSEDIARRYAADVAECAMGSLKIEAARQSISVDELMSRIQAAMDFGDLNVSDVIVNVSDVAVIVSDVIDLSGMEASLFPCMADAMQRAGVSYESEVESLREQFDQTRP